WRGFNYSLRATGTHFGRAFVLQLTRVLVFIFALLNLHLFWGFALWTAENFAGMDVALVEVMCTLGNPVYLVALVALAWWLLTPFNEAVNYLFFIDARTRYEGLDLWQRVEELFPVRQRNKDGMILLAIGLGWSLTGAAAAEEPLPAVKGARKEIALIRGDVQ